jgi:hypothetical protein
VQEPVDRRLAGTSAWLRVVREKSPEPLKPAEPRK